MYVVKFYFTIHQLSDQNIAQTVFSSSLTFLIYEKEKVILIYNKRDGFQKVPDSLCSGTQQLLVALSPIHYYASLVAQLVKSLPVMQETWVRSLGWEDPLEKEMAAHSSILAWRIPWTEEPGGLQSMGSQESDTTQRLHHHHQDSPLKVTKKTWAISSRSSLKLFS